MCNNSLIFLTTNTSSNVLSNGIIPLTTIQRRRSRGIQAGLNSALLAPNCYYLVNASVTFTAPATGDVTITLQKNGVDVPGISATTTVSTADSAITTLNISGIVRVYCNEDVANITLVNTDSEITVEDASLTIIPL